MAALLGLFWKLLREGRLKVARGRSWQPEIGMEHASRGRRSGNKGVGARWRGRFRIFSARHRSRTKVSHAENSGMTTVFFLWGLLRCRGEILSHPRERRHEEVLVWGILLRLDWEPLRGHGLTTGVVRHACRLRRDGTRRFLFGGFFCGWTGSRCGSMCFAHRSGQTRMPPQERRHEEVFGF